ncbi:MAG: hypothetical protein O3B84_01415, partial [Chloroflexi bacterium]|nr:hypothetical protein [Chloroflexota bacterium]
MTTRQSVRLRFAVALAVVAFAAGACAPAAPVPDDAGVTEADSNAKNGVGTTTDRNPTPIFQVMTGGGLGGGLTLDRIPRITIWSDGRVVFLSTDGTAREGMLTIAERNRVIEVADDLYNLDDEYSAFAATDAGGTVFTVESPRGHKSVSVYGLEPDSPPVEWDALPEARRILAVYQVVRRLLPSDAPPWIQEVVITVTDPRPNVTIESEITTWPADLRGYLHGDAAREAATLVPFGSWKRFQVDGQLRDITVVPVFPRLDLPSTTWPVGGLPRHPSVLAYFSPGLPDPNQPYLYVGPVDKVVIADWYRTTMAAKGWRLVEERDDTQTWARAQEKRDPLVYLTFSSDHLQMRIDVLDADGLSSGMPVHPATVHRGGCLLPRPPNEPEGRRGVRCHVVRGIPLPEVAAWYAKVMGYIGWVELEPNIFQQDSDRLELTFRQNDKEVEVLRELTHAQPNSAAYFPGGVYLTGQYEGGPRRWFAGQDFKDYLL